MKTLDKSEDKTKTPMGVKVDKEIWRRFRILALIRGTTATILLESVMQKEINNNSTRKCYAKRNQQ